MLAKGSYVRILDNSGARLAKCIHIFGSRVGKAGSTVVVTIRAAKVGKKVKKGEVHPAVIAHLVRPARRFSYFTVCFFFNSVILLKKGDTVPLSNRIPFLVFEEVRRNGYYKIASLALGLRL